MRFAASAEEACTGFCFLMGSLGIGGIPLWSGYVSKTLLHESMVEYAKAVGEGPPFW